MCCGLGALACCLTSAACSCACAACPSCKNSTSSRIVYAVILLLGVIVSVILLQPGLAHALHKIPYLCSGTGSPLNPSIAELAGLPKDGSVQCDLYVGYRAVYAVCFGMTLFFFGLSVLMIQVKSSKDPRSGIQNGFWLFKILAFVGLIIAGFFIPWSEAAYPWMVISMILAFVFILIQLVLIVDLAHAWAEFFYEKVNGDEGAKCWRVLMICVAFFFFALTFTGIVLMYVYYAGDSRCHSSKAFVSINLCAVVLMTVCSLLPAVQRHNESSTILQPSVIAIYITFLTWSAISSSEQTECNPSLTTIVANITGSAAPITTQDPSAFDGVSVIALIIWFISIVYASVRTSTHSNVGKLTMQSSEATIISDKDSDKDSEKGDSKTWDNEKDGVAYSYCFYHFMLMLGTAYAMLTLTNWYRPMGEGNNLTLIKSEPAMWVKISSSWVCVLIYLWSIFAPVILSGRDFN